MKLKLMLAAIALCFLMIFPAGCASIFGHTGRTVRFESNPPGSKVKIYGRYDELISETVTPKDIYLACKNNGRPAVYNVRFESPSGAVETKSIAAELNTFYIMDWVFFWPAGVIDWASGSSHVISERVVNVSFPASADKNNSIATAASNNNSAPPVSNKNVSTPPVNSRPSKSRSDLTELTLKKPSDKMSTASFDSGSDLPVMRAYHSGTAVGNAASASPHEKIVSQSTASIVVSVPKDPDKGTNTQVVVAHPAGWKPSEGVRWSDERQGYLISVAAVDKPALGSFRNQEKMPWTVPAFIEVSAMEDLTKADFHTDLKIIGLEDQVGSVFRYLGRMCWLTEGNNSNAISPMAGLPGTRFDLSSLVAEGKRLKFYGKYLEPKSSEHSIVVVTEKGVELFNVVVVD